jgi:aryl-alcohol dehydrogenase (NADP+)
MAAEAGLSLTRMAVAWVLGHPAVTSAIVGASRPDQLDESLAAAGAPIDPGLKTGLDELTAAFRRGDDPR